MFKFLYRRKMIKAYWRVKKLNSIYGDQSCSIASSDAKADLHFYAYKCGEMNSPMVREVLGFTK